MDIPYQLEKTAAKSTPAHLRSGSQFLEDLRRRERSVFLHGERIEDPASHPAFSAAARSIARLYDFASLPENRDVMTFSNPESTSPVLRCYQIPKSAGDLHLKRLAAERWAELSFGFMGRTPDHVANFLSGFAAKPSIFAEAGRQYAENIVSFYEFMRDNHLFAAYAIVPPQIDRSKPPHAQQDPRLYAGVIKETDAGIVLAGGQQLATAGVFAGFLLLSCIHPLQRGDENYAISVALPIDTPGLKLYSRRAFTLMASDSTEYPLTTRFDESDCFVILDNAFVPWERVFVYRNIELCRDQWFKTPAHLYGNAQAQTRFAVKLRFFAGLANRLNREIGHASNPAVQMRMGELLSWAAVVEGMLDAQVANATIDDQGVVWPSKTALYSLMALQSEIAPRVVEIIRELSGAVMITLPSSTEDFDSEHTSADVRRYFASADFDARSKVRLMWLIWDSIGSEFASRSLQYEKFYGGAPHLIKLNLHRSYDYDRADALVEAGVKSAGAVSFTLGESLSIIKGKDNCQNGTPPLALTATELAEAIRSRHISSREAVESCVARHIEVHSRVNAVVDLIADEALTAADKADAAFRAGEPLGPLHGVPVTVKINVDYAGRATTNGVVAFHDLIAREDSVPVLNLRKSGAVIFGRTNVPAFSTRYFTDNDLYGRTLNPHDPGRTPGGSSGGAAVAVAVGIGPIAHGNDRAGSIRYPAYACGVAGLRPTVGRVPDFNPSTREERGLSSQLTNVQGPLARNVADLRLGLLALAAFDPRDPWWSPAPLDATILGEPIKVAVFTSLPGVETDPAVLDAVMQAAHWLEDAGYIIEQAVPPRFLEAAASFWSLLMTEERAASPDERAASSRGIEQFGDSAVKRARASTQAYAVALDFDNYIKTLAARTTILREWLLFFQQYPLLLMPVSWQRPVPIDSDQHGDEPMRRLIDSLRPLLAPSVLGLPGLAVPTGMVDGVPLGVQLVASRFQEAICLRAGEVIESRSGMTAPVEPLAGLA